jgi:hypothetical protein
VSADADARRIAGGPLPSALLRDGSTAEEKAPPEAESAAPHDPLRLCIFATVAVLGWLAGPAALTVFAAIGFVGYWRARRAGLLRSRCFLRDTRLVIAYLGVLTVAGVWGTAALVARLLGA